MALILLCAAITAAGYSQSKEDKAVAVNSHSTTSPAAMQQTPEEMVTKIMGVVGLKPDFEIKEQKDIPNIDAVVLHHKRYIRYNPEFINWIAQAREGKWACLALFAHEIGHHLNGHTLSKQGSSPAVELEADEFAGFVLGRLGATLDEAQAMIKYIASAKTSRTHPGMKERMTAIQDGWARATLSGGSVSLN